MSFFKPTSFVQVQACDGCENPDASHTVTQFFSGEAIDKCNDCGAQVATAAPEFAETYP